MREIDVLGSQSIKQMRDRLGQLGKTLDVARDAKTRGGFTRLERLRNNIEGGIVTDLQKARREYLKIAKNAFGLQTVAARHNMRSIARLLSRTEKRIQSEAISDSRQLQRELRENIKEALDFPLAQAKETARKLKRTKLDDEARESVEAMIERGQKRMDAAVVRKKAKVGAAKAKKSCLLYTSPSPRD